MGARRVGWGAGQSEAVLDDALIRSLLEDLGWDAVAGLVRLFVEDAPARLGALSAAVAGGDAVAAAQAAHALKSSSSSVGALALADRCADVQRLASGGQLDRAGTEAARLAGDLAAAQEALAALLAAGSEEEGAGRAARTEQGNR